MQNLLDHIKLTTLSAAVSAGTTTVDGSVCVDMQGFDGVVIIAEFGDVTSGSVPVLKAMQADSDSTAALAAITGGSASITATASNLDENMIAVDVFKPVKRYIGVQLTRPTQNAVVKSIIAVQYSGRKAPYELTGDLVARTVVAPTA